MTDNKVSLSVNPGGSITSETPLVGSSSGVDDKFRTNISSASAPNFPRLPSENSINSSSGSNCTTISSPQLGGGGRMEGPSLTTKLPCPNVISNNTGGIGSLPQPPFLPPQNGNGLHNHHHHHHHHSSQLEPGTTPPLKKTSFQITSVTTIDSSNSNDGGDESGDDLDESHTEDSSELLSDASRHTSESRGGTVTSILGALGGTTDDNFSRNDVFFNPSPVSAMNAAPVIPTCSQYGLAIVSGSDNNGHGHPTSSVSISSGNMSSAPTDDSLGLAGIPENLSVAHVSSAGTVTGGGLERPEQERDHVHNRFKVVKIESTEPFKKGRWTCMDYFDHTTTTLTSTLATGTNRISVASSSPNPQVTPSLPPLSHPAEVLVPPPQPSNPQPPPPVQQSQVHVSPPLMHQQQMQQQPTQIQMVPTTTEMQHGGDGIPHNLNNNGGNGGTYQHLAHMNLNPHLMTVGGMEYSNQGPTAQNLSTVNVVNPPQNLYQQNPVQQQQVVNPGNSQQGQAPGQQQQQYYGNSNLIQQQQQPQPFQQQQQQQQQQAMENMPVQQISQYSQQNQQPLISQQQQHPAQSLPHGAVTQQQMGPVGTSTPSAQQQQQVAQSLGHDNLQLQKQSFLPAATSQVPSPSHFQNQQEQLGMGQGGMGIQQPQQGQGQGQGFQQMMTGIPSIHQQHLIQQQHVQPMQIQVPQTQQSIPQNQPMYAQQTQMQHQPMQIQAQQGPGLAMSSQMMGQPQQLGQQFGGPGMTPQQMHPLIQQTQQQPSPQQQQQQMMSQQQAQQQAQMGMQQQTPQMSNMIPQSHQPQQLISQPPGILQQSQQPILQTLQQQLAYQPQQQQNVNTQQMPQQQQQQPILHQSFQPQAQTMVPQQQMMSAAQQQGNMIQQPQQMNQQQQQQQQQQGMPSSLQPQQQQQHPLQLQGQGQQMGMVGGQPQQYQPAPQQQSSQPTLVVSNLQQQQQPSMHQTSSTNQMGVQLPLGGSMLSGSSAGPTSGSPPDQILGHPQPPIGVVEGHVIQQQQHPVNPVPIGVTTSGQPSGDTTSAQSILSSQARRLLEESVVANDDGDSASGTNTVAIDNKIEQAMDLVKSHLMFAVREEVEVLKERIAELMERINHLEYENTLLRTNASPETLAQLQQSTSKTTNPSNTANT